MARLNRIVLGLLVVGLLMMTGCTYNHIYFERGSVRLADKVDVQPGSSGDDAGPSTTGPVAGGGEGKLSPGGSNILDGWLQMALVIQQGGETPSQTTPSITVPASALPGTP